MSNSPDTCSCSPGACHGGHTIDVGPSWVCLTDERLRQLRDDPNVCTTTAERSMAAELLAARARITELGAERDQHAETARQATNVAIHRSAQITAIRHALAQHPRCDEHPEGDAITCGWKRVVASVQAVVDAAPDQREPIGYTVFRRGREFVSYTNRYFGERINAEQRAAELGPAYHVAELREVSRG